MVGSGTTTLITYTEEMYHVMKILKYPEGFGLSLKGGNKLIQNQKKARKLSIDATLLRNMLTGKREMTAGEGGGQLELVENFNAASSFN